MIKFAVVKVVQPLQFYAEIELPRGDAPPQAGSVVIGPSNGKWVVLGKPFPLDAGLMSNPPSPLSRWMVEIRAVSKDATLPPDGAEFTTAF